MERSSVEPGSRQAVRNSALTIGTTVILAALVYLNTLSNGFAYDDIWIIQSRDLVHGLDRVAELLVAEYWPEPFGSGLYRPLTLLSFAFDWWLWGGGGGGGGGGHPGGFHLVNLILHVAVTGLLTALLLRYFPWWAALFGGAVFAVHPVHTEAVANVVGRGELLTALFVVAAGLIYLNGYGSNPGRGVGPGRIAAITALYLLAIFSKESGVVLPALLLVLDAPRWVRSDVRTYLRDRLPLLATLSAVLIAYLGLRTLLLGAPVSDVRAPAFVPDASLSTRLFTMARVWPRYFELLFLPTELSADYSPAVILPASHLTVIGAVGFGLVIMTVWLAAVGLSRRPELTLAVAWAAIALLPVSNLLFSSEIVLAERTFYLPSVAVAVLSALGAAAARERWRGWVFAGLVCWITGASIITVRRNPVWRTTETVYEDLLERHPESMYALWGLGDRRLRLGDWDGAKRWYYRSLDTWPYQADHVAQFAVLLADRGELAEAERMAERAVALADERRDNHSLLGVIRLNRNDPLGALEGLERARAAVGEYPLLHSLRADAYAQLGRFAEAARAHARSIRLQGSSVSWRSWLRLADLYVSAGDTGAAFLALENAERLPDADPARLDSLRALLGGGR